MKDEKEFLPAIIETDQLPKKDRFITYELDGEERKVPAISGGQLTRITVTFLSFIADQDQNTLNWHLRFSSTTTLKSGRRVQYSFRNTSGPTTRSTSYIHTGNDLYITAQMSTSVATSGEALIIIDRNLWVGTFIANARASTYSSYSFQPLSSVSIADGVADTAANTITWDLTFTNAGSGFSSADITPTPSNAAIIIGGAGNNRTVTLDLSRIPTSTTTTGNASFVIAAQPFSDSRFISDLSARTSNAVSYTLTTSTTVSIASGTIDIASRSISWAVTFSNAGTGLTADDLTFSPSNGVATITGVGNTRTIKLTIPGTAADSQDASFSIDDEAFSDRRIISPVSALSSDTVEYSFPELTTRTTVTISAGVPNIAFRTVSWTLTFSNAGSGLGASDITSRMPSNAVASVFGTGNTRTVTLNIPGSGALSGDASFVLASDAFTDRVITGDLADRTAPTTSYSFGSITATTNLRIAIGRINPSDRTISWLITFSNVGNGFDASDITPSPSNATVTVTGGGSSNQRTVTLLIPGSSAESGNAQIVVGTNPFTNRVLIATLANRTSDSVAYSFAGRPETTISIADGIINEANRAIEWEATFSNVGQGLTSRDIIQTPNHATVSIRGGSGSDKRIISLSFGGTNPERGTASFIINSNAFTDRIITSSLTDRTSNSVQYNFIVKGIPVSPNVVRRPDIINTALEGDWRVFLNDIDITELIDEVNNINYSLDYDNPYSFRIAEASIVITNDDGQFSSYNPDNLFSQAGYNYGFRCPITIFSGSQFVFFGNILEVYHNEKEGSMRLKIADLSSDLNNKDVIDIGLEKRIRLKAFDRQESSQSGIYPFPTAVSPPSDESLSGITSAFLQELYFQKKVRFSGELNPRNVTVEGSDLKTEGAYLRQNDDPIIQFKAPFRDYSINNIVKEILKRYNIDRYQISLPNIQASTDADFTRIGRPGYETEASRKNIDGQLINLSEWHWTGAVTDMILDPKGPTYVPGGIQSIAEYQNELYMLSGTSLYRFDMQTLEYRDLGSIDIGSRAAGLAVVNDRFFVLGRNDISEIHLGDQITTTRMNLSGDGVNSQRRLTPHRGHAVGLATRRDELFVGYRQGIQRAEIDGNNIRMIDMWGYVPQFSEITSRLSSNNIEYFNGRFYVVGRPNNTLYSFEMEHGYTPTDLTITSGLDISDTIFGAYQGQLVSAIVNGQKLVYLNSANNQIEEINNPTFYFLYSARQSNTFPHLLQYQVLSDRWDTVYRHAQHAEFWQMATKDYQTFYILGNDPPVAIGDRPHPAAYNTGKHSGSNPNTNKIWKFDRSTNSFTESVNNSNALRPQLAQYYHLGFESSQNRFGFLPDTRKSIMIDLNDVYYIFATNISVGIAKIEPDNTVTPVITTNIDNWHSECGVDFQIANDTIYMSTTFINDDESTLKIVSNSLGQAPRITRLISTRLIEDTAYDESIRVVGDPSPTVTSEVSTGTLPTGLELEGIRLHGTPTGIPIAGTTFSITWTATNNRGSVSETVNFRVKDSAASVPSFGSFTATSLTEGTAYDQTITATGTPTPTITSSVLGTLPTGLTLDDARLHGTPTNIPDAGSTFIVRFTATNTEGTVNNDITFTVANTP